MARVVVVGGGFGGMASAVRLAKLGHTVTLLEARDELGGALGSLEVDGFRWDVGPSTTALPAVVRDLFRKSGRPLDRELDLVPVDPIREHRFEDGTRLGLPHGRAAQERAIDEGLGGGGADWLAYTESFHETWETIRREYLERPWAPDLVDRATRDLVFTRDTLHKRVRKAIKDERLRAVALHGVRLEGHDPRNVPSWMGFLAYVEQKFGVWTVPGGLSRVSETLVKRLGERRVEVRTKTTVHDVVVREGRVVAVATEDGDLDADVVVVAIDPRGLPALARLVRHTMPALPPVVCHLGLGPGAPELPAEVVFHGDPAIVVRTTGQAPDGGQAWTLLGRGRLAEDIVTALARLKVDVRPHLETRIDRTPREIVEDLHGSPYGVAWQGRRTLTDRLSTRTPLPGVFAAGAHATPGAGVPLVGLGAALVAQEIGPA